MQDIMHAWTYLSTNPSQAEVASPDPVILPTSHFSGAKSKSKNYTALPGQPYLFSNIQQDPDTSPRRRSSHRLSCFKRSL